MNKKTRNTLLIIYLIALLMMSIGATMAYFILGIQEKVVAEADVSSATETSVVFDASDSLSINASYQNFNQDIKESLSDTSRLMATLKKGSNTNEAKYYYNVDVSFSENTINYSTGEHKAEVILTIIGPDNKELIELPNKDLEYVQVNDISGNTVIKGFDVTNKEGKFMIAKDYLISADSPEAVTQVWQLKLTFVNFDYSQDYNIGKTINGVVSITPVTT